MTRIYSSLIRLEAVGDRESVAIFIRDEKGGHGIALKNVRFSRPEWMAFSAGVNAIFESDEEKEIITVAQDAEIVELGEAD